MNARQRYWFFLMLGLVGGVVRADGMVVDKVYHPYVLPNEREIEWRIASNKTTDGNLLMQRLGLGHAVSETLSLEAYLIGERDPSSNFELHAYELEARWMLTEQGRYWADWGMLFEVERQRQDRNWEASAGLLFEKEIGQTSLTMNAFAIYEWGDTLPSEWETEFRLQYRYRWRAQFQPAIEVYTGEDFQGVGPGFVGLQRFSGQRQLKWEAGFVAEVGHARKEHTFRLALEYEF